MARHKGALSPNAIDRGWPYQVALPASQCTGSNYRYLHAYCIDLSLAPLGHAVVRNGEWYNVFCFAEEAHADKFRLQFHGMKFDPACRGRGKNWAQWKEPKPKIYGRG